MIDLLSFLKWWLIINFQFCVGVKKLWNISWWVVLVYWKTAAPDVRWTILDSKPQNTFNHFIIATINLWGWKMFASFKLLFESDNKTDNQMMLNNVFLRLAKKINLSNENEWKVIIYRRICAKNSIRKVFVLNLLLLSMKQEHDFINLATNIFTRNCNIA